MNKVAVAAGLVLACLVGGCFEQAGGTKSYKGPLLRYHFAGRAAIAPGTNAARFKEIDALPSTAALRADIAQKTASAAFRFWKKDLPAGAADQSPLLKPVIEDLITGEAFVEVRGRPGKADLAVAAALAEDRAALWDRNLRQLVAVWKLGEVREITAEGFKGWEIKKTSAPDVLQVFRAGRWTVLGLGHGQSQQIPAMLAAARQTGRPVGTLTNEFLELAADLPALRPWFPIVAHYPLPPILASMSGRGDGVRTEVRLQYSGKIPWTFEPWRIPTNVIGEPLTSFTVAQGLGPLFKAIKGFSEIGLNPMPTQMAFWGIHNEQCRMNLSVPVVNATEQMQRLSLGVPRQMLATFTNLKGNFLFGTNRSELILGGVPWIAPMLRPVKDGRDEYLVGTLFPLPPKHTPVPEELFSQIRGRNNLMYYDWEITEHRLNHGKQFYQLASIINGRRTPETNTVSKRWLLDIGSKLGNTATEVTQVSPQELVLVRRSHVGFTGFELATLSLWLDTPGFPYEFDLPPAVARIRPKTGSTNSPGSRPQPVRANAAPPASPAPAKR